MSKSRWPEEATTAETYSAGYSEITLDLQGIQVEERETGKFTILVPAKPINMERIMHALDDGLLCKNKRDLDQMHDEVVETIMRVSAQQFILSRVS